MVRSIKKRRESITGSDSSKLVLWVVLWLVVVIALSVGFKYYNLNIGRGILDDVFDNVMMSPTSQPSSGSGGSGSGGCLSIDIPLSDSFIKMKSNINGYQVQQASVNCNDPDNGLGTRPAIGIPSKTSSNKLPLNFPDSPDIDTTKSYSFSDRCIDANILEEYGCGDFCVNYYKEFIPGFPFRVAGPEQEAKVVTATIKCLNGCHNGACR